MMDTSNISIIEYNTYEKALTLFNSIGGAGNYNNIFVGIKDARTAAMAGGLVGGMINGMEFPFDGLLVNQSDKGITMFFLKQPGVPLKYKIEKMEIELNNHIFIPNENITNITIKKFTIFNSKTKSVKIQTTDKTYKLIVNLKEDKFPFHEECFSRFIGIYGNDKKQPQTVASTPLTQPVQPQAAPGTPIAQPVQPQAAPGTPIAQPVQPQAAPGTPIAQPVQPQINFDPNTGLPINKQ